MDSQPRIAFFDAKTYDRESFNEANQKFGFAIHYYPARLDSSTVRLVEGFNTICAFVNDQLDRATIEGLVTAGIKLVALRCAGHNNICFQEAYGRVHVVRVPAYSPYAVAEHTMALLLALNRKIHKAYNRTREGNFALNGLVGFDLHGKTAGIIGTGKIGQVLIRILKGFGLQVLAYDVFPNERVAQDLHFQYVDLPTLFKSSDLISLHCPLTSETHHLIDKESIALMKPGVFLLNAGRGPLIDTKALIEGLKSHKIGAAGLDVYEEESNYFFEDFSSEVITDDVLARLLSFNNVLVTSHQAFLTREALGNISQTTLQNIADFYRTGICANEICYHCAAGQEGFCARKNTGRCF